MSSVTSTVTSSPIGYALDTSQAKTIGIGVIVALLVIGAIISAIITAIVWRVIVIIVVLVAGIWVWNQRSDIEAKAKRCDATFFGVHLKLTPDQMKTCQDAVNRTQ